MVKEYLKKGALVLVIGIAILIVVIYQHQQNTSSEPNMAKVNETKSTKNETNDKKSDDTKQVIVDVKGAVQKPGIYEVSENARVNDVIEQAGGFAKQADQTTVNLAQKVQDEMMVQIKTKGEKQEQGEETNQTSETDDKVVHLNDADQSEIETLPGIGPSKAEAILKYREDHGSFKRVEDLLEIPGIGEKTLDTLKELISVP